MSTETKKQKTETLNGVPDIHSLVNDQGVSYNEFRKSLKLKQSVVYFNMIVPWLFIIAALALFYVLRDSFWGSLWLIPPATIWLAFWMQAFTVHIHEAAHFNIHSNRATNDLLADVFITPFTGLRVKDYRISHWKHHRFLGLLTDTEISYHKPISARQVVEGLTGIYLLKTVWRYFRNFREIDSSKSATSTGAKSKSTSFIWSLLIMLITQLVIVVAIWYFISIFAAFAWLANTFVAGPFVAHLRQSLEHRSLTADKKTDFASVEHGPVNRIFGTDFFSRYFGGAGFNRHLLHHYDPSISYTCFPEMEQFLDSTSAKDTLDASRTTYVKTFFALARQ